MAVASYKSLILHGKCRNPRTSTLGSERRSSGARRLGEALEGFPASKAGGPFFSRYRGKTAQPSINLRTLSSKICYIFNV